MNFLSFFSLIIQTPKLSVLSGTNVTKVIPEPYETQIFNGFWQIPDDLSICISTNVPSKETVSTYFQNVFKSHTKKANTVKTCPEEKGKMHHVQIFYDQNIETEGYNLSVNENGVRISAFSTAGFFYASETLDQLIDKDLSIAHLQIHDYPRFQHRGLMLDVSSHFFGISTIKFILTEMSHYKLNKFHWHLTDDQGWRLEIKKYPKLAEIGSKRSATPVIFDRTRLDNVEYGPFYYTQSQIKEIVQFAKSLHIDVIPEIELPGHSMAALAAYPEYSCTGGPFQPRCLWGASKEAFCAGNAAAVRFLEDVLDEVSELFDGKFVHIGGEDFPKARWQECQKCQARMKAHQLKSENELQSWFVNRIANHISSKGKKSICLDDSVSSNVDANNTVINVWHNLTSALEAANHGFRLIMSPASQTHFDHYQNAKEDFEYAGGFNTLRKVYSYNPSEGFSDASSRQILGVQANMRTEFVRSQDELTYKLFPRLCALSEVGWTRESKKSWELFERKLRYKHIQKLRDDGINPAKTELMPVAEWKCSGKGKWEANSWNITQTCPIPDKYKLKFTFVGGGKTQLRNLSIVNGDQIVGTDHHLGFFGPKNNAPLLFDIQVSKKLNAQTTLAGEIKCKKPSNGKIFMDFDYKVPEYLDPDVIF